MPLSPLLPSQRTRPSDPRLSCFGLLCAQKKPAGYVLAKKIRRRHPCKCRVDILRTASIFKSERRISLCHAEIIYGQAGFDSDTNSIL